MMERELSEHLLPLRGQGEQHFPPVLACPMASNIST
jgi:hypothetical protein